MNTRPDFRDDLELARTVALEAGGVVLEYFGRDPGVHFKSADQPVTAADLEADRLLRERLGAERPGYGWLSEETADSPLRLQRSRVWVVDPIDGTNSFIEGRPEFVISIGLAVDGIPEAAVVYNPATGELYHAVRGEGAYLNGERIRVASAPAPGDRAVLIASRTELLRDEFEQLDEERWTLSPLGSTAYRMAKVAEGSGHAFYSRGPKHEWDVCGAALVVAEAGGRVQQIDGEALRFNRPDPVFRGILVAAPGIDLATLPLAGSSARRTTE